MKPSHSPTTIPINAPEAIAAALEQLYAGQPVVFPTDTVYGIGVPAFKAAAVERLYEIKQRPRTQAIPVLLAEYEDLPMAAQTIPPLAADLARRYWPGALTLVLPAALHLPAVLLACGESVAVRIPDHPWLRLLIRRLGQPLAATSANPHGEQPLATASEIAAQLGGQVGLVLDGGQARSNTPSTVVDCTGGEPQVLRAGGVRLTDHDY